MHRLLLKHTKIHYPASSTVKAVRCGFLRVIILENKFTLLSSYVRVRTENNITEKIPNLKGKSRIKTEVGM